MDQGLIPRRYAKALIETARQRGSERRLYDLAGNLVANFMAEPGLNAMVENPFIAPAEKIKVLDTAAGATADDTLYGDFLRLLERNKRLDTVRDCMVAYRDLYRKSHGISRVTVTTAAPLDKALEKRLKAIIEAHLGGGKIEYTALVDPDLIGGFTVAIDNELLDASVAGELNQLKKTHMKSIS